MHLSHNGLCKHGTFIMLRMRVTKLTSMRINKIPPVSWQRAVTWTQLSATRLTASSGLCSLLWPTSICKSVNRIRSCAEQNNPIKVTFVNACNANVCNSGWHTYSRVASLVAQFVPWLSAHMQSNPFAMKFVISISLRPPPSSFLAHPMLVPKQTHTLKGMDPTALQHNCSELCEAGVSYGNVNYVYVEAEIRVCVRVCTCLCAHAAWIRLSWEHWFQFQIIPWNTV